MLTEDINVFIEIPPTIEQQEIWDFEKRLKQINDVTVELREAKDLSALTLMILHITTDVAGILSSLSGSAKAVYEVSKVIYDFIHISDKNKERDEKKKKIVITKKGKRIEIYNLSMQEIESLLKDR